MVVMGTVVMGTGTCPHDYRYDYMTTVALDMTGEYFVPYVCLFVCF